MLAAQSKCLWTNWNTTTPCSSGVAITPDKSRIFVTASGSDVVTVIDTKRLLTFSHNHKKSFVNDLSASANYVTARIAVGKNPRGMAMSPNGKAPLRSQPNG